MLSRGWPALALALAFCPMDPASAKRLALLPPVASGVALDAQNGYPPYHFGQAPPPGLGSPTQMGQITSMTAPDVTLNGARARVTLLFNRAHLTAICLTTHGEEASQDALHGLEKAFGPGHAMVDRGETLWHGQRVWLKFVKAPKSPDASIWWMSVGSRRGAARPSATPGATPTP